LMHAQYRGSNTAVAAAYGPLRAGAWVVAVILCFTVIFGMLVPLESAAIAQGSVVVLSKRKTVQHLEGGIVKRILVKEGEVVEQGQPLLEISDIAPKANREILLNDLRAERASEIRLQALHDGSH